jgi:hypothetical protein
MNPWVFLPIGYLFTILVEAPILLVGLARRHDLRTRLFAGVWLTLCTYPVVVLVLPPLLDSETNRLGYLLVAETFAPLAECLLFYAAFDSKPEVTRVERIRNCAAIILANLASFLLGEWIYTTEWFRDSVYPWLQSLGATS